VIKVMLASGVHKVNLAYRAYRAYKGHRETPYVVQGVSQANKAYVA
jgi:hypothetical protein